MSEPATSPWPARRRRIGWLALIAGFALAGVNVVQLWPRQVTLIYDLSQAESVGTLRVQLREHPEGSLVRATRFMLAQGEHRAQHTVDLVPGKFVVVATLEPRGSGTARVVERPLRIEGGAVITLHLR